MRPALYRLALASLLHPRLAAESGPEAAGLASDVLGLVGKRVGRALGFCGAMRGHDGPLTSAQFSPDGLMIVSASGDETMPRDDDEPMRVWSAVTGELERTLEGNRDWQACMVIRRWVIRARFSPDGTKIVSGLGYRTVRVRNAVSGELERTLKGHCDLVTSARFGPDGTKIVSASRDKTVRVWNAESGECERTLEGHTAQVNSAQFGPDGTKIVSASSDGTVRVWSAKTAP